MQFKGWAWQDWVVNVDHFNPVFQRAQRRAAALPFDMELMGF